MVCAKHRDVPKAKIKKYREARKAKKQGMVAHHRGSQRPTAVPRSVRAGVRR
jgi:hypothetical protein